MNRYVQYKGFVKLAIVGMIFLNLMMACSALKPINETHESAQDTLISADPGSSEHRMSTAQKIEQVDQEVRKFWVRLLPFWED